MNNNIKEHQIGPIYDRLHFNKVISKQIVLLSLVLHVMTFNHSDKSHKKYKLCINCQCEVSYARYWWLIWKGDSILQNHIILYNILKTFLKNRRKAILLFNVTDLLNLYSVCNYQQSWRWWITNNSHKENIHSCKHALIFKIF